MSVLIIGEIGVNHNGDEATAYKLIDAAVDAGADVCKFQKFKPVGTREPYAWLCLPDEAYPRLSDYCKSKGVGFACTAFEADDLEWLLKNTEMAFVKISSGEWGNKMLLHTALHTALYSKLPVIQSLTELSLKSLPTLEDCLLGAQWSHLWVVAEYPTPPEHAKIKQVSAWYDGLSDHSGDIFMPLAAVALGAQIIECHITLDKEQPGPDHKASLEPHQFKEMVRGIRAIEKALA